ncbi:MAG TPA: hypothetical protein VFY10_11205, partial [Dehalococcoidia bacterium]|nr:hypothetical protein [Dehalococcoidia bacterium]
LLGINDWTLTGFRPSTLLRDSASILTKAKYNPTALNGYIAGSITAFGMIHPANFSRRNRDMKLAEATVNEILREPNLEKSWDGFADGTMPNFVGVKVLPFGDFDVKSWPPSAGARPVTID